MIHRAFIPWRVSSIFGLNLKQAASHRRPACIALDRLLWLGTVSLHTDARSAVVSAAFVRGCLSSLAQKITPSLCTRGVHLICFTQQSRLIGERRKDLTNGRAARERSVCNVLMYRVLAG